MTEQTLVQWVRGELTPTERRQVTEWMIRCRDPQLPLLLDGIMQAERDARRDAALVALRPTWAGVVSAWELLLEQGRAALLDAPAGAFAMASDDGGTVELLQLVESELGPRAILTAPEAGRFHLLVTDDEGQAGVLAQDDLAAGDSIDGFLSASGGRSTLWALSGPGGPEEPPMDLLRDALVGEQDAELLGALRLDPREP